MLIQKDTAVEATQVSMTTTLVQERERRGYLPAQSSCFIPALDTVLRVTCRQQREQHLVHLEDGEHEHVLHPDHHRHEAVDVAQVGAEAPVA